MPLFEIYDKDTTWKLGEVTAMTVGTARVAARHQWPNNQIGTIRERTKGYDKHQTSKENNLTQPKGKETDDQRHTRFNLALMQFAKTNGRYWKRELRNVWMNGRYADSDDSQSLQELRNCTGANWMTKYRLPKDENDDLTILRSNDRK